MYEQFRLRPLAPLALVLCLVVGCGQEEQKASFDPSVLASKEVENPFAAAPEEKVTIKQSDDKMPERNLNDAPDELKIPGAAPNDEGEETKDTAKDDAKSPAATIDIPTKIAILPYGEVTNYYVLLKAKKLTEAAQGIVIPKTPAFKTAIKDELVALSKLASTDVLKISALEQSIEGHWAIVVARIDVANPGQPAKVGLAPYYFTKVDNRWKMASPKYHSDPAIKPLVTDEYTKLAEEFEKNRAELTKTHLQSKRP